MDFYHRISMLDSRKNGRLRLVVVGVEAQAQLKDFLSAHGVEVDAVMQDVTAPKLTPATPTLIRVNSKGEVIDFWKGQQSPQNEERILNILS